MRFELVVPCYNESKSLCAFVERTVESARSQGLTPTDFRLVLVENGSRDNSRAVLSELANGEYATWFRVVAIDENQGYGFGLLTGLSTTTAPIVGYSHADQQCDPLDAIRAFLRLERGGGPALVKGRRTGRNWKDFVVSRVFEGFAGALLNMWVFDVNAQPKVFPRTLVGELADAPHDFAFDLYALYRAKKLGWILNEIPVLFPPRVHGLSNWAYSTKSRLRNSRKMISYIHRLSKQEGRL